MTRGRTSMRDRNPAVVGIVGIALVSALVAGALSIGTFVKFRKTYQLTAIFSRTGGLETGADVRIAGVSVGSVNAITPDFNEGTITVALDIDVDADLGPNTTAEISAATLLGGYYVRLGGEVVEPYLKQLPRSDPLRVIPLARTVGPTSLNDVLDSTTTAVTGIDFDAANHLLQTLSGAAARNRDSLPTLLDDFQTVATALASRDAQIRTLVTGADSLSSALAARDAELGQLVDSADRLLAQLASRRNELTTILAQGSAAVGDAYTLIAKHRQAIDQLIVNVGTVTSRLSDELPAVNRALTQAQTLFPLLVNTLDPAGGFSIRDEGLLLHPGQIKGVEHTVQQLLGALGLGQ